MRVYIYLVGVVIIISLSRAVDHDCLGLANALPAMEYIIGNLHQHQVMDTYKKLVYLPLGRGALTGVVENQFQHPADTDYVIYLLPMEVPPFDHPRISGGAIDLPEFDEKILIIASEKLH